MSMPMSDLADDDDVTAVASPPGGATPCATVHRRKTMTRDTSPKSHPDDGEHGQNTTGSDDYTSQSLVAEQIRVPAQFQRCVEGLAQNALPARQHEADDHELRHRD